MAAVFLLQAISKMTLLEDEVGVPLAYAKIVKLVARYIDSIEHPAGGSDNPRACKAVQKRSSRG